MAAGLAKGEVLAIMAPNSPEYGVVFHAVALAGGVVTTVNPTYTAGEVHHQLVDAGATRPGHRARCSSRSPPRRCRTPA